MKHILFFVNSMQPSGGIERVIATLANKLSAFYEITVLVKDEPVSFYKLNESIKIKSINKPLTFNMHSRFSRFFQVINNVLSSTNILKSHLKVNSYDYYYVVHPLSVLEFKLAGIDFDKLIISEHAARTHYNVVYRYIKKLLYKKCNTYVVPTTSDTIDYLKLNKFPAVNIPHFRSELAYSKAELTNKTVLNIGRFTNDKQQLLLLKIWKEICGVHKYSEWKLNIVGQGELQEELIEYIKQNKLDGNVNLLPPIANVAEYYLGSTVFLLTSISEGYGMVLLEAISFGVPCISFDCPSGPKDIITDGYNGYLVPLNDVKLFTAKLIHLLNNHPVIEELGNNAFQSSFNWNDELILKKWINVFN